MSDWNTVLNIALDWAPWEPTKQVGTPWIITAENHDFRDVKVIVWLCILKIIFVGLTITTSILRRTQYSRVTQQDLEQGEVKMKTVEMFQSYYTVILQLLVSTLGICAVKMDSQEILKTFCIVILVGLVIFLVGSSICLFRFFLVVGSDYAAVCTWDIVLAIAVSKVLQVFVLVCAWKYAFPVLKIEDFILW